MSAFLVLVLIGHCAAQATISGPREWEMADREDLMSSLKVEKNTGLAKNVIIFMGDGMGPSTLTAARSYSVGEDGYLAWERFPYLGALKTYAADKKVTDSAQGATSLFTGVKTNNDVVSVSRAVKRGDCKASLDPETHLTPITAEALAAGKSTGFVTTARVTHSSPSTLYAHSAERNWECGVEDYATDCKDIGRQMVEDFPGRDFNVLMGGGKIALQAPKNNETIVLDVVYKPCFRTDGRDLIKAWKDEKASRGLRHQVVNDTASLLKVDPRSTDYLLGVFADGHMKYHYERDTSGAGSPSLMNMTFTAIKILMKNKNGFLLIVESELVDIAHHAGKARKAIDEVVQLSNTVNATMQLLESAGIKDETLVIVTSDHAHTLTIGGYAKTRDSVLEASSISEVDGMRFTTLTYANGLNGYHYVVNETRVSREDPSTKNTSDWEYAPQAAVLTMKNSHGGQDVLVYATGPYAHLFHHMHEQTYVAEVVRYAAKIGPYKSTVQQPSSSTSSSSFPLLVTLLLLYHVFLLKMNLD